MSAKIKKENTKNNKIIESDNDVEDAELISESKIKKNNFNEKKKEEKFSLNFRKYQFLIMFSLLLFSIFLSVYLYYFFTKKITTLENLVNSTSSSEISKNVEIFVEKNFKVFDNNLKNLENKVSEKFFNLERKVFEEIDKEFKKINSIVDKNYDNEVTSIGKISKSFENDLAAFELKINKDLQDQKSLFDKMLEELNEKNKMDIISENKLNNEIYNYQLNFLKENFKILARKALKLSILKKTDGSTLENLKGKIKSLFVVRSLSVQNGNGVDAVLSRAEDELKKGNILETLKNLENLPDEEKSLFTEWSLIANSLVSNEN